jgi:hypothetical protein
MNYISLTKLAGPNVAEERWCNHCGAKPPLALKMLDPVKGHLIHIFRCECGQEIWCSDESEDGPPKD